MRAKRTRTKAVDGTDESALRQRILGAAFAAFTELGYSRTSTIEIATRARVSKRDLYSLVGNKLEMLVECIRERSARFPLPAGLPDSTDREMLRAVLTRFGERFLTEVTDPNVVETFRLAIAEAIRAPEVARALDEFGREKGRSVLRGALAKARENSLVSGEPDAMAREFFVLLWGDLIMNLLLRTVKTPTEAEIARRSAEAASALLVLHPGPRDARNGSSQGEGDANHRLARRSP
jgi:AcrR family transcriptional regulator